MIAGNNIFEKSNRNTLSQSQGNSEVHRDLLCYSVFQWKKNVFSTYSW